MREPSKGTPAVGSSATHDEGDQRARNGSAGGPFDGRLHLSAIIATVLLSLAAANSTAHDARADICVIATPGLMFGCKATPPPTTSSSTTTAAEEEPAPFRLSSTTPRFDPRRLAVTFTPKTSRAQALAVLATAGARIDRAIPALHAYLVAVDPTRLDRALAALQTSRRVATAGREPIAEVLETTPNDAAWPDQVGLRVTGFPRA